VERLGIHGFQKASLITSRVLRGKPRTFVMICLRVNGCGIKSKHQRKGVMCCEFGRRCFIVCNPMRRIAGI
jgi:hypothetical protein